jgi:hypothetical protein
LTIDRLQNLTALGQGIQVRVSEGIARHLGNVGLKNLHGLFRQWGRGFHGLFSEFKEDFASNQYGAPKIHDLPSKDREHEARLRSYRP